MAEYLRNVPVASAVWQYSTTMTASRSTRGPSPATADSISAAEFSSGVRLPV
jgi:hypothetical protein